MAFSDPGSGRAILDQASGPARGRVTPVEACSRGDILGYSSGWVKAFAKATEVVQGRLVALEDCALLADGVTYPSIGVAMALAVDGYSGATPGNYVYVAEGTGEEGEVTQTAPTTTNDADTIIGIALSATRVLFFLNSRADSLSA